MLVVVVDLVGEVGLVEGDGVGAYFGARGEAARLVDAEVFGAFEGVVDGDGVVAARASAGLAEVDGVVARAEVEALAVDADVVVGDGEGVVAGAGGVLDADAVTAGAHVGVGVEVGEAAVVVVACCRRFFRGRVGFVVVGDGFVVADNEARAFFRDGLAALGAAVDGAGAGFDVALDDAFVVDAFECGE